MRLMKIRLSILTGIACLPLLTGCGDKAELTEYGFVQAVALDQAPDGGVRLTTHFYNPSSSGGDPSVPNKPSSKGLNITTEDDTVFEAIRDIPIHFGRKAKWDHMRIILISEELAKSRKVSEMLDFFSRDHEPRATVHVLICKGKAKEYLSIQPFIEYTIGQQLKRIEEFVIRYTAKTTSTPLLDLAIQLKNETKIALLPYAYHNDKNNELSIAGTAILKEGKLVTVVSPTDTQSLLMLINKYDRGIYEFPCTGTAADEEHPISKESLEVMLVKSKAIPSVTQDSVKVAVHIEMRAAVGELRCSSLQTREDQQAFEQSILRTLHADLQKFIASLQKKQLDALGIGNKLYRSSPSVWKRLKPDWDNRFAQSQFDIQIKLDILNTGMEAGTPFSK